LAVNLAVNGYGRSRIPAFLHNVLEMINDQQESTEGEVVPRPSLLANSPTQPVQQRSQRLKCIAHELLVRI
jgi:hypothetical protein